jgi:hypothetical protein
MAIRPDQKQDGRYFPRVPHTKLGIMLGLLEKVIQALKLFGRVKLRDFAGFT